MQTFAKLIGAVFLAVLSLTVADASVVITGVNSATELAYAADVSSSDLLQGLTPTVTGWNYALGADPASLNDGAHGDTYAVDSATSIAWTTVGATATYNLGTGNGYGWNITSIQSIAAWVNVGFGNQAWDISVRYAGDESFTALPELSVDYQPLSDIGATKVVITNDSGILIQNVGEIRFTANSVNGGAHSGAFTFREIDVFGSPAESDDTDADGLTNRQEDQLGTDPENPDSDDDAVCDEMEVRMGSNPLDAESAILRIMPLGDSITAGYTDNPDWTVPFNFGYRSGLYTRLNNAGYRFQFVGTSPEPWDSKWGDPSAGGTVLPALDLRPLGQDRHEGYGGKTIAFVESIVTNRIAVNHPDIILLMIGINGISADSPAQLNSLVNTIVTAVPDIHLIVAQITPRSTFSQVLWDYNIYIRDTLVPTYANAGFNVSTVDLYSLFLTDPEDPTSIGPDLHANGINHPMPMLYDEMAEAWFNGIRQLGFKNDLVITMQLSTGQISLSWSSRTDRQYTLRSSPDLSSAPSTWPVFGGCSNLTGVSPGSPLIISLSNDAGRFFLIEEF